MAYLIDTHTFLWFAWDSPKISKNATAILEDAKNDRCISIASFWEMAIKASMGKLTTAENLRELERIAIQGGIRILPITFDVLEVVGKLPWVHKDPFDRLIIATALAGDHHIVGVDPLFEDYGTKRVW